MQEQLDTPKAVLDENLLIELVKSISPEDTQELPKKLEAKVQCISYKPYY